MPTVERFHLESGDPVPGTGFDRAVILGGAMGAYDVDSHPWLEAEKDWIRELVGVGRPGSRDLPGLPSFWPMLWVAGPSRPSSPKSASFRSA